MAKKSSAAKRAPKPISKKHASSGLRARAAESSRAVRIEPPKRRAANTTVRSRVLKQTERTKNMENDDSAGVDALLVERGHPLMGVIGKVRRLILNTDDAVTEGIKWNGPSFYHKGAGLAGWFAALNLRSSDEVMVVLHLGAKPRDAEGLRARIDEVVADNALLMWHSQDRASITIGSDAELKRKVAVLQRVVASWLEFMKDVKA